MKGVCDQTKRVYLFLEEKKNLINMSNTYNATVQINF